MARLRGAAWIGALALGAWLLWGHGFANYDALYSLVWGREMAHGHGPSFGVSLAPTPHPLANLAGLGLAAFSPRTGEDVLVVVAFVALGAVGVLVYALGARWFGTAAGVLAAVLILTREPVLSYGTRAYVDLPYLALVLGALLAIERRRLPFVLLALAGLLRPEAWLFSGALLVWRRDWRLLPLAVAAPVLWLLGDLVATGDPLHSLTGTRENVATLGRKTGLANVPLYLPRRVGEVLREPVLAGAVVGGVLSLWLLRRRALLPAGHPWRLRWAALGMAVLALQVVYVPAQAHRLSRTRDAIALQDGIEGDLWTVGLPLCPGDSVGVVNHRLVPVLALRTGERPGRIAAAPLPHGFTGTYVGPAGERVAKAFVLDPRDPSQQVEAPPRGLAPAGGNRSWAVLRRC